MIDRFKFQRLAAFAALLSLMATACTSSSKARFLPAGRGQNQDILVEVMNDNFLDMGIFVMVGGVNLRLGDVTGKSSDTFTLDPTRLSPSQGLRLLADPVGSRNAFLSDEVAVFPGTTVVLTISADLQQSYVILR